MHECEALCITSADNQLSIRYDVNHLTKAFSREETAKKISNQAIQMHVCLLHFKNIFLSCQGCMERDSKCDNCVEKGVFSKNLVLRPCSYCLHNELKYIKLVVLGISVVFESRNQTAQGIFKEIKLSGEIDSQ